MGSITYFSNNQSLLNDREQIYSGIDDFEHWLINNSYENVGWYQNIDVIANEREQYISSPSSQLIHYSSALLGRFLTICSKHKRKPFIHLKINTELSESECHYVLTKLFNEYRKTFEQVRTNISQINFILSCKPSDYIKKIIELEFYPYKVNVI